jgi:peptidoglycan/xylan/chitin deacetylase (PgdA/CDA1 family)
MKRPIRNLLMRPYYYGTLPYRWYVNARRLAAGAFPVTVLFYHRVADDHPSPWTIGTQRFARQIQWLRRHCTIVSLADAQARLASGANHERLACVTFDDGYADNCAYALPLLVRHRVPFTYFVSLHHVLSGAPFPHDVEVGRPHRVNTVADLRALAAAGVEIGAHTRSHENLGRVRDHDRLYDELVTAGRELSAAVRRPVNYFAFPYGLPANLNVEAFHLARETGYRGVCSAYGGYNLPGEDPFHSQRIHADPEWIRWKNYLTVDPRKVRNVQRFEYLAPVRLPDEAGESEGESSSLLSHQV